MGVAALSSVVDPAALTAGLEALRSAGLEPVRAPNLESRHGLFAGDDADRLAGLHELAEDATIEAILFARGGHGVLRLLPAIDWELLGRRPRWFVGFSDLTPLLAQVVDRLGLVALHGPMVAAQPELMAEEIAGLHAALGSGWPLEVPVTDVDGDWAGVEGRLSGGCLSMLAATLGTEWAVPTRDSILFLEDVNEPLYRIDRMLQQLRLAGAFEGVRGVVLGSFDTVEGTPHEERALLAATREAVGPGAPVAWGCPSGHCRPNRTLAIGARARIDSVRSTLVLESR